MSKNGNFLRWFRGVNKVFFEYKKIRSFKNDIGKRMKKQELEIFHKFMLFPSLIDFSSLKF